MKKRKIASGVVALLVCTTALGQMGTLPASAQNPIVQTSFSPDPAPVVFGDELWVFTGCDKDARNGDYFMVGWQAFSTTDMQNWTNHGMFLKDDEFSWATADAAWASQCIERNGKYYFYFTTVNKGGGGRAIGVGVADNPEGPYKDVLGKPLCGPDWAYIDPTVMIDDDGQAWLMFGNPDCYYVKLKEDMVTLDGPIQKFNLSLPNGVRYGEGPWITKHDNLYYLVFASFDSAYNGESISYCTGPTVTGPWTFGGTIHQGSNCFTTHGGIIDYKGHSYSFYHMNGLPGGGSFNRSAACEEFTFNADGSIPAIKSTSQGPEQIEAFNPYQRIEAETMSWSEGIKTEKIDAGTLAIGYIENGDYTKLSGVDFGEEGAAEFAASVSSDGSGGKIEIHLDSVTGPMIGTVDVPVTGGWQEWETVKTTNLAGAAGKHDVFFRFTGGDSYLFNVDWWQFVPVGGSSEDIGAEFTEDGGRIVKNKTSDLLGDVTGDGKIDAADMNFAKTMFAAGETNSKKIKQADINCSGKLDADDIAWYADFLTGKTTEYLPKAEKNTAVEAETTPYAYPQNLSFHKAPEQEGHNYFKDQPANHGEVVTEYYNGINGNKKMYVYVPYGYDENKKYNVFYLMHGGSESEETCFNDNNINIDYMLDNMIAAGEIEPMLVVTPTFNNCPNGAYDVHDEMRKTIIPYIETKYSTYANGDVSESSLQASRYHRAYGGFSMGAGSTWKNFCFNLDIIAYFMPLSGHCWDGTAGIQNAIDRLGPRKDEYYIFGATGTGDLAHGNMAPLMEELKNDTQRFSYGSDFSQNNLYFIDAPGETHWWGIVRHYIYNALPLFFHEHQND